MPPPSLTYYRAVEGPWAGALDLHITDWRAFHATRMPVFDRLSLLSVVSLSRLLGRFHIETSVDCSAAEETGGEVIHTTRISKWGVTLLRTRERLVLDPDGRAVTMHVTMWSRPFFSPRELPPGPARVDEDGMGASYRFAWFGSEMQQRGERSPDGTTVTLTQDTSYSRGVQVLRRP